MMKEGLVSKFHQGVEFSFMIKKKIKDFCSHIFSVEFSCPFLSFLDTLERFSIIKE